MYRRPSDRPNEWIEVIWSWCWIFENYTYSRTQTPARTHTHTPMQLCWLRIWIKRWLQCVCTGREFRKMATIIIGCSKSLSERLANIMGSNLLVSIVYEKYKTCIKHGPRRPCFRLCAVVYLGSNIARVCVSACCLILHRVFGVLSTLFGVHWSHFCSRSRCALFQFHD